MPKPLRPKDFRSFYDVMYLWALFNFIFQKLLPNNTLLSVFFCVEKIIIKNVLLGILQKEKYALILKLLHRSANWRIISAYTNALLNGADQ